MVPGVSGEGCRLQASPPSAGPAGQGPLGPTRDTGCTPGLMVSTAQGWEGLVLCHEYSWKKALGRLTGEQNRVANPRPVGSVLVSPLTRMERSVRAGGACPPEGWELVSPSQ